MVPRATELQVELATEQSEAKLRELLRNNPLAGDIQVTLEREPNALHAAMTSGDVYNLLIGYRGDRQRVVASGARFEFDAYINGAPKRIGYLGEFRMDGGLRRRRRLLLESFAAMRRAHESGSVPFYFTTVVADNLSTRRLFEAGLPGFPVYQPLEKIVTLTIPVRSGGRGLIRARQVRPAGPNELRRVAHLLSSHGPELQFQPVWEQDTLQSPKRCRGLSHSDFLLCFSGEELLGCVGLWDQRSFKQTVIHGYAPGLRRLRPFLNVVAPLLHRPRLPSPGARLETTFLSHLAVRPDDSETLISLIRFACRDAIERGLDYLMLGVAERDPACATIRRNFSCHRYTSMLYVAYWQDGREEAAKLDARIPRPEMAIL